jgi:metal transporter CNNM
MNFISYIIVFVLVALSGIFSGLTIGMFSLNLASLERKIKLKNLHAKRVYQVRKNGNWLLCTLLLGNVAVNSTIAVFLGTIAPGVLAGTIATGLIVVFGEILPQAIFSRFALIIGSYTSWLVRIFMITLAPVAYPLAFLLDKMLGKELPTIWHKKEIEELIKSHEDSPLSNIDRDEERIILGALSFSEKKVLDIMTPKPVVFTLDGNLKLNSQTIKMIKEKSFTRIPVYQKYEDNIIGILFTKDLIGMDLDKIASIAEISRTKDVFYIKETMRLDTLLNHFITNKFHLAPVFDDFGIFKGIVTLEDVIEEILKIEIVDEGDKIENLRLYALQKFKKKLME